MICKILFSLKVNEFINRNMKQGLVFFIFIAGLFLNSRAQNPENNVEKLFSEALSDTTSYGNLRVLCKNYSGRITGSEVANEAVEFTFRIMQEMNIDRVEKQPVAVPVWERGEIEKAFIQSEKAGKREVPISALGWSVGTGESGISANIVEVLDFGQLEKLGSENIKGKIVFYNRPMDATLVNTFAAYGSAADQRMNGAAQAAKYGAIGVVVRSLTTSLDDFPHTGVLRYIDTIPKIPAVAISTNGANLLHNLLTEEPELEFHFIANGKELPETISYNVIGEIRGTEFPEQIITVGGHLDAWDTGEGAHDDGAGCMQSIEVLRLFQKLGIKPKRTIRAVMFMDEEVAQRGGKEYALQAEIIGEQHYFALEADRGAFSPRGFGVSAEGEKLEKIIALKKYFEPYGITQITAGGGGVDIGPLRKFGTPLSSYITDMQRYFDVHHSGNDTFEQVNFREFQMGSAAMASFIYLVDFFDL